MTALAIVVAVLGAVWLVVRTVEVRELRHATLAAEAARDAARAFAVDLQSLRATVREQGDKLADVERTTQKHAGKLRELMPR